jgi:hypothetical protein
VRLQTVVCPNADSKHRFSTWVRDDRKAVLCPKCRRNFRFTTPAPTLAEVLAAFVRCVRAGKAAKCQIPIRQFPKLYGQLHGAISEKHQDRSSLERVKIVRAGLSGYCPRHGCPCGFSGDDLARFSMMADFGPDRVTVRGPGWAWRFVQGRCPNPKCSCTEVVLEWSPNV